MNGLHEVLCTAGAPPRSDSNRYWKVFYLFPVLLITLTEIGLEVAFEIPSVTGSAVAVSETNPRFEGLQEQVATIFGELPVVNLFLHPGNTFPLTVKVTLDATVTFAVMTIAVL